jgi:hypothetical protein
MTAHSIIAPSSAARRWQCPASTRLEAAYPEDGQSPAAAEGEAAHWAAAEMLQGRLVDIGQIAPNGVVLTQEMVEGADLYYDDVVKTLKPGGWSIEQQIRMPRVHPESFGTPDFAAWADPLRLFLYDYKFGHRVVEVYENPQLIEYVAGLLPENVDDRAITVTVKIVQPRAFHRDGPVRSWTFRASDIRPQINVASNAAHEALADNPRAAVGTECRDCRARHACPTLQQAAYRDIETARGVQPLELPPAALALELALLRAGVERMSARLSGLEEQALSMLKAGKPIPGWAIEHGNGRQRWARPAAEVLAIGDMLGLKLGKPPEPVTPKQAVAAGLPPEMLTTLAETPRGEAKLARDEGARARAVFGR